MHFREINIDKQTLSDPTYSSRCGLILQDVLKNVFLIVFGGQNCHNTNK